MAEELRAGINNEELIGVVKEQKLKTNKGKSGNYINGSLIIKTGEFSEIELNVFVNEETKSGKTSKIYETLKGFIDKEYKTMANCESDEDTPAKVRVYGNNNFTPHFTDNMFKDQNSGQVIQKMRLDLGFGTIYIDDNVKKEDYKATFDVEMCIQSIKEEEKDDELTGRVIVNGYLPMYDGSIMPMKILAGKITDDNGEEIDFGQDLLDAVEEGMTIEIWGDLNYKTKITKIKKGGSLGKAKIEEKREYINELIAAGAVIQEDEDKEFDVELIKKAKIERDNKIEEIKNSKDDDKKATGLSKPKESKRPRPKF